MFLVVCISSVTALGLCVSKRSYSLKKNRESEPQESSNCYALKVSCGKCGNGLGHEFVGDGPGGKGSRF